MFFVGLLLELLTVSDFGLSLTFLCDGLPASDLRCVLFNELLKC